MSMKPREWFAVYRYDHLQDGHEEGGCLIRGLPAVLEYIEYSKSGVNAQCRDFLVFRLGEQVPIKLEKREVDRVVTDVRWVASLSDEAKV